MQLIQLKWYLQLWMFTVISKRVEEKIEMLKDMILIRVKYISKLQIYYVGQPWGLQLTQHFFSQWMYFFMMSYLSSFFLAESPDLKEKLNKHRMLVIRGSECCDELEILFLKEASQFEGGGLCKFLTLQNQENSMEDGIPNSAFSYLIRRVCSSVMKLSVSFKYFS